MLLKSWALILTVLLVLSSLPAISANLLFPQNRNAFFSDEVIELAVSGLAKGNMAAIIINPATGAQPYSFTVTGDGKTLLLQLPPYSLFPTSYTITLDGKNAGKFTVSNGIRQSSMLVSQTAKGWSNFTVSNAAGFGLLDAQGQPLVDVRGKRAGTKALETAIAANQPALCYMYWTGYVTHKPFGSEKSWANAEMQNAMRLLNYSTAQHLRPFSKIITEIGTIDEPGLSWGPLPAGGMASGFPNHDELPWYEARGWKYTQDVGNQSDEEWKKYMEIRCAILGESFIQAKSDIKEVWPEAVFSTDAYALHAIMDGTDSMNQLPNDVPSSHVFFDFFGGPLSVPGQMQLEKAARPQSKLAHAMNGQLTGIRGTQRPLYNLLMGGMLQGGLSSNWWLNTGGMTPADLEAVNKPTSEMGTLFHEMELRGYQTALLWSYNEISLREKRVARLLADAKGGQQPTLMLPLPDNEELKEFAVNVNPYEEGQQYCDPIFAAHQVLRRSGYPCQIIDERLIPDGGLKEFNTLLIIGQTYPMPKNIMDGISSFVKKGGKVVVDKSTTVIFPGAIVIDIDYSASTFRTRNFRIAEAKKAAGTDKRAVSAIDAIEASLNPFYRAGIPAFKAAMAKTKSLPLILTNAEDLSVDQQISGDAKLITILNGHEVIPTLADPEAPYPRYNPAPYNGVKITLQWMKKNSVVYCAEGLDWKTVRKIADPTAEQTLNFAPGEMKLYLVLEKDITVLQAKANYSTGKVQLDINTKGTKAPWPVHITISDPEGKALVDIYRAVKVNGKFMETFPIGANSNPGTYVIKVNSLLNSLSSTAPFEVSLDTKAITINPNSDAVRIFDEKSIIALLAKKPEFTIALGNKEQQEGAEKIADALKAKGFTVDIKAAEKALSRTTFPMEWNPTVKVYSANGEAPIAPAEEVKLTISTTTGDNDIPVYTDETGKNQLNWRLPSTHVKVGKGGLVDYSGNSEACYNEGIELFINAKNVIQVLNGAAPVTEKVTDEFRARWQKPWTLIGIHVGGYQMPPALPYAYTSDNNLIVIGDSSSNLAARVLQASELFEQVVDDSYPGTGKALIQHAWSPFAVGKNVIFIGASDEEGIAAGINQFLTMVK